MKKSEIIFVILISAILWCIKGQAQYLPQVLAEEEITISTRDAQNFVEVYAQDVSKKELKEFYLGKASIAMDKKVMRSFVQKLNKFTKTVKTDYQTYKSVENVLDKLVQEETELRVALDNWKKLSPNALLPDVYFAVGTQNLAEAFSHGNLVINLAGLSPNSINPHALDEVKLYPQVLRSIIGTQFYGCNSETGNSNLAKAIKEGSKDFLVELISGENPNAEIFSYATQRKDEILSLFQEQMYSDYRSDWYAPSERKSEQLARWVGYQVAADYYQDATDKSQAIQTILKVKNYDCFYKSNGKSLLTSRY